MTKNCAVCGKPFEAKKPQATYCGAACRKRKQRGAKTTKTAVTSQQPTPAPSDGQPDGGAEITVTVGLVSSVVNQLTEAKRLNTYLGQQALRLAVRLETAQFDTGSAYAALSKELRVVMAEALANAETAGDEVDEVKARRDAKLARAAAG